VLAMRLSVEYIILITIAFAVIVIDVFSNFGPFGGSVGLVGLPPLSIGVTLGSIASLLPVLIVVLALTYGLIKMLGESSFGVLLRAIREDQVAARAIGLHGTREGGGVRSRRRVRRTVRWAAGVHGGGGEPDLVRLHPG